MFKKIKNTFPNWPDDVIEQWLVYHAERPQYGWPPPEPIRHHGWYYVLGRKPVDWWADVLWTLESIEFSYGSLSNDDKLIFEQMFEAHFQGKTNSYSLIEDSAARIKSCVDYISKNGVFPRPPIALQYGSGLRFIDGSHRVAAMVIYQKLDAEIIKKNGFSAIENKQDIWIGRHKSGFAMN